MQRLNILITLEAYNFFKREQKRQLTQLLSRQVAIVATSMQFNRVSARLTVTAAAERNKEYNGTLSEMIDLLKR